MIYSGPATLHDGPTDLGTVALELHLDPADGTSMLRSWSGHITDPGTVNLYATVGRTITIRLPEGQESKAIVAQTDGTTAQLAGTGPPPT